jgi:hypothetical protein
MPVFINLKAINHHLAVLTNRLLIFSNKNHNQNYKHFIGFIIFLKNKKIVSNRIVRKGRKT